MHGMWHDIRWGIRLMLRHRGFTIVAVLSLALGIGANTTIFSATNALLLKPFGVEDPDGLVSVFTANEGGGRYGITSYPDYQDLRDRNEVFSGLAAYNFFPVGLRSTDRARVLLGQIVTGNYFSVLGVQPSLGRAFVPEEDRTPDTHPVAVISHRIWEQQFGADPGIVGQSVLLNDYPFTVVGVAPEGFKGPMAVLATDIWVPTMMVGKAFPYSVNLAGRVDPWLSLVGRLEPGVTPEQAQSSLDAISLSLQEEYPSQNQGKDFPVVEFSRNRLGQGPDEPINLFMALLMGVVGLVLLIACFNVANLFLARATTRHREIALRISVGAGRRTIIRQLLVESIMISMVAGGLGLLIALWGGDLFSLVLPQGEVPLELDLSFDRRVFLFTFVLAVATGVLFGLFPALQTTRAGQFSALKDGPFLMKGGKSRLQSLLVIGQVALSLVLLVGAGLFVRSLQHTLDVDPGFALKDGLVVPVNLGYGQYTEEEGRLFFARIAEQVAGLPGVERVAQTAALPLGQMHGHHYIYIEGYDPAPGEFMLFKRNKVGAEYLATMGMEVVAGRGIDDRDREDTNPVMVVNETFVRRFFPDGNALGRMVAADLGVWREVVGVVEDGKYSQLDEPPEPYLMIPLSQAEYLQRRYLVIESSGDPTSLMAPVRQYLSELDPGLPVTIMTMEDHLKLSTGDAKGGAVLVGIFGLLAVVLAMVGVYGVMSYTVTQRINEFGVRMALGADRQSIVWTVLGWGARTTLVGVIAGLILAGVAARLLSTFLFGVRPLDPLVFLGVAAFLVVIAQLACFVPARLASRADPVAALRVK